MIAPANLNHLRGYDNMWNWMDTVLCLPTTDSVLIVTTRDRGNHSQKQILETSRLKNTSLLWGMHFCNHMIAQPLSVSFIGV